MKKEVKPTRVALRPGQITTDELVELMQLPATDARNLWAGKATWEDGSEARLTDVSDLAPVEDAQHLVRLFGVFEYADGSQVTVCLNRFEPWVEAKGDTARDRLSQVSHYWANLPNRSWFTWKLWSWVRSFAIYVAFMWSLPFAVALWNDGNKAVAWTLEGTAVVLLIFTSLCVYFSNIQKARRQPVVLSRRNGFTLERVSLVASGIIALVGGVAAILLGFKD
ncbi:hypothetical protein [Antrihabitans sp. YC2-6]|uniref:hypothetical protein n=1 Tax=Antrihabitans sp. YC2-6 TaxID=2799498 RepID=UPI0018F7000F|nr:hypothetical protein [Antrihabitans sp. YC2-6]MBJ8348575.1 hypothetical protein [Antrihabitans sp. YC2-6]